MGQQYSETYTLFMKRVSLRVFPPATIITRLFAIVFKWMFAKSEQINQL